MGYKTDRQLEDDFAKTVKYILGGVFFAKDLKADLKEGTDFMILSSDPVKVGVRLRRYYFFQNHPHDFTLRWSRPSGVKTEIDKIREGLVTHIFYGFINEQETKLVSYFVGDLSVFRKNEPKPAAVIANKPPDSKFAVYNKTDLPKEFFIHKFNY